jgi:tetratricopeptide (TPR) repeat protein
VQVHAQNARGYVREGNKLYKEKRFKDADSLFRKGMETDTSSFKSVFNLGDALYQQGKYEEAANYFNGIAQKNPDKLLKAHAYHNMGNCYLSAKKYQESVDAYKNSLRLNPTDEDTRYNLAYALKKLKKEQQQQQQKKDQDQKNDKDKKNDQDKDKDKKKDENKDKQDKDKQDKNDQQNKQQQQQQQQQMSKEDAQRMLDALNNDEKKVQDKLKKKNAKGVKVQVQKDW